MLFLCNEPGVSLVTHQFDSDSSGMTLFISKTTQQQNLSKKKMKKTPRFFMTLVNGMKQKLRFERLKKISLISCNEIFLFQSFNLFK